MDTRPVGVRIGAVLYFATAVWFLALVVLAVLSRSTLAGLLNRLAVAGEHPLLRLGALLPVYFAAMALVIAVIGWGLWTYQNWSRLLTIAFLVVTLVAPAWQTLGAISTLGTVDIFASLLRLIMIVIPTWYFTRVTVRRAFGRV